MKRIITTFSFALAVAGIFSSCKKQLELFPTGSIDDTKAFQTVTDLDQGTLAVYSANPATNKIYIGSILADDVRLSSENRGQGQGTFKFQYTSTTGEVVGDFSSYYRLIDRIHRVLAVIDNVPAKDATETTTKAKLKAELVGMRGIAYYELLVRYAAGVYDANALGVPLILKSDVTAKLARSTVGAVATQIESDLAAAKAETNLPSAPPSFSTSDLTPIRLSKAAIASYQARLALWKKDWTNAATYASEAITLSGKTLATGATYTGFWQDANQSEGIFAYKNNGAPQLLWTDTNGDVFFEPSTKLKKMFNRTTDFRFNTFFGPNTTGDTSIVKKYPGSLVGPQINTIKLVRLSELYLIRAEAYAESNQLALAATSINAVRTARISGYTPVTFATSSEAVTAVLDERYKELCFEGFRFFDLRRKGLPVTRDAADVTSTNWISLPVGNFRFTLPIDRAELDANPNNSQNPGY